jgi:hypothetical protein
MSNKSDDGDMLLYLAFGAAVVYVLYKNNFFSPAGTSGSGGTVPSLPAPGASAGAPAAVTGPNANPNYGGTDFGSTTANPTWD